MKALSHHVYEPSMNESGQPSQVRMNQRNISVLRTVLLIMLYLVGVLQLVACVHRDVKDKVVVITGASSGFGKGVAQKLAAQGAKIVVAARRTELLEDLVRHAGDHALAVTTDVGKEQDIERLAEAAIAKFGRIDVWINNAGVGAFGRFEEIPLADHTRLIQTNLLGVIYGSHFALRQFRKQGAGTLINIASVLGKIGSPYYASYSASKFAVVGFGQALNQELRLNEAENIHISTISPMGADTPFCNIPPTIPVVRRVPIQFMRPRMSSTRSWMRRIQRKK